MVMRRRDAETPEVCALRDRIDHLQQVIRDNKRKELQLNLEIARLTGNQRHLDRWEDKLSRYKRLLVLQYNYIQQLENQLANNGRAVPRVRTPSPPPRIDPAYLREDTPLADSERNPLQLSSAEATDEEQPTPLQRSPSSDSSSSDSTDDQPNPPRRLRRSKSPPRKTTGRIRAPPKRSPDVCYPTWELE